MRQLKILVGCEESQEVCKAFRLMGCEAYSCDILPCSGPFPGWHFQEDVFEVLKRMKFDACLFFPPCTHLATSGAKWFPEKIKDGRQEEGIKFFLNLANVDCQRVAIENPVGIMSTKFRKPDQIIQPYYFGDPFSKRICLWLKGLPKLYPTDIVAEGPRKITKGGKSMPVWYNMPPGPDRAKIRSKTFPGIARAMADQWVRYMMAPEKIQPVQLELFY